jgi:hypothetical protein
MAFVTHWLRGRYGMARELPVEGDGCGWRVDPAPPRNSFLIHVDAAALEAGLGQLRDWMEEIADHAIESAPQPPDRYHITIRGVEVRTG